MTDPKEMRLLRQKMNEERKDEMKNRISMALKDPILQQGFEIICKNLAELKKENAELKRENRGIKTCSNCDEYVIGRCCNYSNGVCHHWKLSEKYKNDDELTNAKEVIKSSIVLLTKSRTALDTKTYLMKAEQFLRETDIDNAIQKANEGLNLDKIAEEVEDDLKEGCPDVLCEGCTEEDCTARKLGLIC